MLQKKQQHSRSIPVLSVPGDTLGGCPGDCGCCSPEWGKSPVEMCGLVACWVGWVLTGDLSDTRTGAVGLIGRSEKRHNIKTFRENKSQPDGSSERCGP